MSAWGKGGTAKSCNALVRRVEENDPSLVDLVILPSKTFGAAELDRIAAAVENRTNTKLQSLSASGHAVPPSSLSKIGSAIASPRSNIVRLAIGDRHLGDDGVVTLCSTLEACNGGSLESLDLEWKGLSLDSMAALGKCFGASPRLQKLNLSRNESVSDQGITEFCKHAIARAAEENVTPFPQLANLDLSECAIGPIGASALAQCLRPSTAECAVLLELKLNSNPLGPSGCRSVSSLICGKSVLVSLSVAKCNIGDEGVESLREAVATTSCDGLEILDVSGNGIGPKGAEALSESLTRSNACWTSLCDLNISGNSLGEDGVKALSGALQQTDNNERGATYSLDLSQTCCGADGAAAAIRCGTLSSLRLFGNKLGSKGFEALSPILKEGHPSLKNLDLGGNNAEEKAVVELLQAVAIGDSKLQVLELGGNQGGNEVEETILELKKLRPDLDVARDRPRKE